ncbi:EAL domain-containing protein [Altererythrobacter sp. SALINAS58]|uniref:putative bifunctional diguanylate cyclase/phosphodiesterase n=1 Tax=Alteripontixanthobacter muriae TaxID=2705546 RepID=UPI001576858B|nr:EAL domain-containing protein [Alteripontixanthobacter muriae]NTZ42105.1 EAL domain-containing protein [Alteripontixanthobacter muriae]
MFRTRTAFWAQKPASASPSDAERVDRLMSYAEEFEDRWFWETDAEGCLTYLSKNVAEQLELFGIKTLGERLTSVFRLDQGELEHARSLNFHIVSRTAFSDFQVRGVKGLSESWWSMSGRPWLDANRQFCGFVGSGTDLTKNLQQEATIKRLATSDSLTGLANRQRMQENLEALMKTGSENETPCALLMLDLDGFKSVNDTLGHPVGDSLLIQVANRLSSAVSNAGLVGRLGGDEFQVLIPGTDDRESLSSLAAKIIEEISSPYSIDGSSITVSCSIGIAVAFGEASPGSLVRDADIALYAAKAGGRATYRFFEEEMLIKAKRRKELEDDLRLALSSDQLTLVYQPVVSTSCEKLTGFEALLRWEHPSKGPIGPTEFIPVAEESGLIQHIGDWVLREAIGTISRLPHDLRIAVNVSPIQFRNPALLSTLANAIGESQIDPSRLELEITEGVFLDNEAAAQKIFTALKAVGVRLALDDFGTGYSSLGYLQNAPFDKIKIDRSFVRGAVDSSNRNSAIIASIVSLSNALGMETTAEGVEHQDEIELVRELGCSHIQGYVYGHGLKIDDLLPELLTGLRNMQPVGHKRSRSPRKNLLRSVKMTVNESSKAVRLRNVSKTGALIDQVDFDERAVGITISIEILEDELRQAKIRWVGDQRAGIEFSDPIEIAASERRCTLLR